MPKISIVTPNYNYGHFLEATIRSVLDQCYPQLEYIVMDDGSSDNSLEVIKKYSDKLSHWEAGKNQGQYKTITSGFKKATGEIYGWLNSDDLHLPWTLWVVGEIFASFPEIEWISTLSPGAWDYNGVCLGFSQIPGFSKKAFLDGVYLPGPVPKSARVPANRSYIQQESTFWRSSLWERTGAFLSAEYGSAGDFELWARFFSTQAQLVGVSVPIAGFRFQSQQQTSNISNYSKNCLVILEEYRKQQRWVGNRGIAVNVLTRLASKVSMINRFIPDKWKYQGEKIQKALANTKNNSWTVSPLFF